MTTKKQILKAIKDNCYDCSGQDWKEVKDCNIPSCPLYPYRMGKDSRPSVAESERGRKSPLISDKFSKNRLSGVGVKV